MDPIMSMQAIEHARREWKCELAKSGGDPEAPPLWFRSLTEREEAALAAVEGWEESEEDLAIVAALCDECWYKGCVVEEEAFLMHAASAEELGCPGFCSAPNSEPPSWREVV